MGLTGVHLQCSCDVAEGERCSIVLQGARLALADELEHQRVLLCEHPSVCRGCSTRQSGSHTLCASRKQIQIPGSADSGAHQAVQGPTIVSSATPHILLLQTPPESVICKCACAQEEAQQGACTHGVHLARCGGASLFGARCLPVLQATSAVQCQLGHMLGH